jgi:hypothetical protein
MARKRKLRKAGLLNEPAPTLDTSPEPTPAPAPAPVVDPEPVKVEEAPAKKGLFSRDSD